jgi:predicted MPP superfamily phosphohydrolase
MSWFPLLQFCGWLATVVVAAVIRTRQAATFMGVILGVYSLIAISIAPAFARIFPLFVALDMIVFLNFMMLSRPRMRPLLYRILISWPSALFAAGTLLAMPWGILMALGFHPWAPWVPYVLAAVGMVQSLSTKREEIDLVVDGPGGAHSSRVAPYPRGDRRATRPLRIVQISDPHLGPFMSVARLARIAQRAVDAKPDLILLTGDFLTMESQSDPDLLLDAMAPLKAMQGKTFACNGNHDHEAPAVVIRAMKENGIELLVDEAREVETEIGPVQIVGMDFTWRDRAGHLARVCREYPRKQGIPRIVLLHDPGAFKHLPAGEGDLVLSGHTHGGQVGFVSLGLQWTFLRLFGIKIPDHGFWARGTDRMWVHRGTGHYGFPLRLGVPAEESVMRVHLGGSS